MPRLLCLGIIALASVTSTAQTSATTTYLSDLKATYATIGWGTIGQNVSVMRTPLTLNGVRYAKGIGTHAVSDIRYNLDRRGSLFVAIIGVDDYVSRGSVRFQVWADSAVLYDSGVMTGAQAGRAVSLDMTGRGELRLVVLDGGDGIGSDHADWADAKVVCTSPVVADGGVTSYLSDMPAVSATIGWGTIGKDVAVMRTPLRLNGVTYAKGIGTHSTSDIRYSLGRRCSRFQAVVGVDDYVSRGSIRFQVSADGQLLYDSANLTGTHPGIPMSVDVTGREQLRLLVTDGGDGIGSDHADWGDARVTCTTAPVPASASFAYWNLAGGNGVRHLTTTNLANPAVPFSCISGSGATVDDSAYGTGTGAAILQTNGAMTEALVKHIASDATVVALGVGEAWGGAQIGRLLEVLGWQRVYATAINQGDAILTRYGFLQQGLGPAIGQTGAEIFKPIYADVCLDKSCTRTMPFFAVHTQAEDTAYDSGIAKLMTYVDAVVPPGEPRIVMGDFNAWNPTTDPHACVGPAEPGLGHEAGIQRIADTGYTSMFRLKNPLANGSTGLLNVLGYSQTTSSCLARAGLPQGHPYKAVDHAFSRSIADTDVLSATKIGVPIGGYGHCAASDHLGLKVTVHVP
jgi:endonuclease/exonuclease/phosphatase family metal-dependent hydrolase